MKLTEAFDHGTIVVVDTDMGLPIFFHHRAWFDLCFARLEAGKDVFGVEIEVDEFPEPHIIRYPDEED